MRNTLGSYFGGTGIKYRPEDKLSCLKSCAFAIVHPGQLWRSTSSSFINHPFPFIHSLTTALLSDAIRTIWAAECVIEQTTKLNVDQPWYVPHFSMFTCLFSKSYLCFTSFIAIKRNRECLNLNVSLYPSASSVSIHHGCILLNPHNDKDSFYASCICTLE